MSRRWGFALLGGAILLPAVVRLACYPAYPGSDDAFIHHAVAANLAAGRGWGIEPGHAVNLSSSPLFTLVAAAVTAVAPDGWTGVTALTLLAACAGVWWTWWAARRLGLDGLPAALLAATNLHLWRWTGTFLETTVAWAIVPLAIGLEAGLRERGERRPGRWVGLGCVLGAAVLLRYELALLVAALALQASLERPRRWRWVPLAAGCALVLGPWLAFARLAFGTLLPTTLAAKASAGLHAPSTAVLGSLARVVVSAAPAALLVTAVGLAARLRRGRARELGRWALRRLALWLPPLAVALFYAVRMDVLQSPGRYMLPFTPLLALLAEAALPGEHGRERRPATWLALALAAQAAFAVGVNARRVAPVLRGMESGYVAAMEGAAEELRGRCAAGDAVLVLTDVGVVSDAGAGPCRIVDGGGLADPDLIGLPVPAMVARRRPRWVVESLGDPAGGLPGAEEMGLTEVWRREFPSHGIARPHERFVVRLYERVGA